MQTTYFLYLPQLFSSKENAQYNNNNNNKRICIAQVCRMTSQAENVDS